jgi:hypothetical protein
VDVTATALRFGPSVDDISNLDLGYSPPYSEALDNIMAAANILRNKLDGIAVSVTPQQVHDQFGTGEEPLLLDVRSPEE